MIEFILGAFLYAKKKKYDIRPVFQHWSMYIPLFFVGVYLAIEFSVWQDWYWFVPYTKIIRIATLLSYIPLCLKYNLIDTNPVKSPAVWATVSLGLGTLLNDIVKYFNSDRMPVFPSLSYWTGYTNPIMPDDGVHVLGTAYTKLIFLSDIWDWGYCVVSVGDLFTRLFPFIIIYFAIKNSQHNKKINVDKQCGV
jgi:hypothetical protein